MPVFFNVSITKLEEGTTYRVTWLDMESNKEDSFEADAPDLGQGETQGKAALDIGHRLFHFLEGDNRYFSRALSRAEAAREPLELGVVTCPKSSDWPLELVAKDHEFLLRTRVHLVRSITPNDTAARIEPPNRPLKLLFMVGSPMDVTPLLDYEKEEEAIFKVTEKMAVDLEVEDSGTLEGLRERLLPERYDVVHLSGHADIKNGRPYFVLETETGARRDVSCDLLWKEALRENPPQLLFLSGCRTGEAGETGVASFARLMVSAFKVPAVVGWGRSVQDDQASVAAEFMYRELCRGLSLTQAVQRARCELMDRFAGRGGNQAWHLMRLFCNTNPGAALVAAGQKDMQIKPRRLKHTYLENSEVKVLAEGFVGRRRQLQQCLRVLKEDRDKIGLLLMGTGGLGKSCLAGKVCERFPHHHLMVVHGILNDTSLHKALDLAFTMARDTQGKEILSQKKEMPEKLQDLCATSFRATTYFFILDDFEQNLEAVRETGTWSLTPGAAQLLAVLLYLLPLVGKGTQLILTCRYGFSLTREGRDLVKQRLQAVTLTGFLPGEMAKKVRELPHIQNRRDTETKAALVAAGCGNPRLMEWLDILVGEMEQDNVPALLAAVRDKREEFIRSHVLRELVTLGGSGMADFLAALSIYRIPVQREGVVGMGAAMGLETGKTMALVEGAVDLSLVERNSARASFQVTPLLREELLAAVAEEEKESRHRAAFGYFKQVCEAQWEERKFEAVLVEEWVYHALACGEEEKAAEWGGALVNVLRDSLAFGESRRVGEWVLAEKKQPLASEFDAFLLNNLGGTVDTMGDNPKAIEYYEQALKINRAFYGNEHPNVASGLNNLGSAWKVLGDNPKAIEYLEQALKIDRAVFGNEHPAVARELNNLGEAFRQLGNPKKAIEYYEQALKIWKEVYGEKHQQVAIGLNNLGLAWKALGEHPKAIEYYEQALKIHRAVFGNEHPNVAVGLNNLGSVYLQQGKMEKAKEVLQKAYDILNTVYGPEHPNTKGVAGWLADC